MMDLVRQFVQDRVSRRLGLDPSEAVVCVERQGTTFLVSTETRAITSRCAVCPRVSSDQIREASELQRVHALVRGRSLELSRAMPMVLDVDPQRQWVVFEHLPGQPLLGVLQSALRRGNVSDALEHLRQTARLLAALNNIRSADLNLRQPATRNADYARQLDLCTVDPRVRRWLPGDGRWQMALARATGWDFESRWGDRLMLVDCQPKNVLISPSGEARCIDIDYATGNPALNLAHFLISLDRLALRHPYPRRQRLIEVCKAAFTQAYLQCVEPCVGHDLAFFYTWLLMRCIRQHSRLHPLMGWYLRRRHGSTLRRFLLGLERRTSLGRPAALTAAA